MRRRASFLVIALLAWVLGSSLGAIDGSVTARAQSSGVVMGKAHAGFTPSLTGTKPIVILAIGLFQSILVARWLGPKGFGEAALILGVPALIFTFFDPQTREAVVRYLGEFTTTGDAQKALAVPKLAYVIDGLLGVVGVVVVAALAPLAATHILHDSALVPLLIVAGAAQIASAPAETSRAVLTASGEIRSSDPFSSEIVSTCAIRLPGRSGSREQITCTACSGAADVRRYGRCPLSSS